MTLGSLITISSDEFKRLAKHGLVLTKYNGSSTFYYDRTAITTSSNIGYRAVPGYMVKEYDTVGPIMGYWEHFDRGDKFKVACLPRFRYTKTKEFR